MLSKKLIDCHGEMPLALTTSLKNSFEPFRRNLSSSAQVPAILNQVGKHNYNVEPPSYVCWFVSPSNYSYLCTINHCYWSYLHQLSYRGRGPHITRLPTAWISRRYLPIVWWVFTRTIDIVHWDTVRKYMACIQKMAIRYGPTNNCKWTEMTPITSWLYIIISPFIIV